MTTGAPSTTPREDQAKREGADKSHEGSWPLLKWFWKNYLKPYAWIVAIAVVFMVVEGAMLGVLSALMEPMFDDGFVGGDSGLLRWLGALLVLIFSARGISSVLQKVLLTYVAQKTAAALRFDLLGRLMQQDGAFHQKHPPGFLIQRVQSDVNAAGQIWRSVITGAGRDFMALLALMIAAIYVDPVWTLLACVGIPALVLPASMAQRYVRRHARRANDLGARLSTRLDEVFHGIVPVKLNGLERYQARRYANITDQFIKTEVKSAFGSAGIPAMIDIVTGIGFMAVLLYGGSEIIEGKKTIGQFMAFFTAIGLAFNPLRRLGGIFGVWQQAAAAIDRIKELLDAPLLVTSPAVPKASGTRNLSVELEGVSLRYGDTEVLSDISLSAKPDKITALVGASGAGKSSIFDLLTRLVDPSSGVVRIGGVATTEMSLEDLRALYSVVTQDALLFDDSLRENIVLGREDVTEEDLKEVLDAAHVSDFLPLLANGIDTQVGPRGSALSGGQRQRVVIARALLRNTPILLLDEATSALDAQSETVVQAALDRLSEGRTTLVIAHRLSTVRNADQIIVMDRGKIVDVGTHASLLEAGGIYAELYKLQFDG